MRRVMHGTTLWISQLLSFIWISTSFTQAMSSSPSSSAVQRILVTGANKGIGKAICERLLTEYGDNTHVILSSRNEELGKQAVEDILKQNQQIDKERLQYLPMDTSSDESVQAAAAKVQENGWTPLYGIINNAGIGWGYTTEQTVNTNYFGPRRVNDAFGKFLLRPGGRIVNVASASGPNFVADLDSSKDKELELKLSKPWTIEGGIAEVDEIAKTHSFSNGYGYSKALLNAYTVLHAKEEVGQLLINSCTPGWIATDLTAGTGAKNPPSKGAVPPCWLVMSQPGDASEHGPKFQLDDRGSTGRYYGSDCIRSPLDCYRGPGDAPYVNDEDIM